AHAEKIGAPSYIRSRASELMAQPKGALAHDDHFHVRIACPSGMSECVEQPTMKRHKNAHVASAPAPKPPAHTTPTHPSRAAPKIDSDMPNLAQAVPGLGSAVIPAPLERAKPTWGNETLPAKDAKPDAVDDPDGILDGH